MYFSNPTSICQFNVTSNSLTSMKLRWVSQNIIYFFQTTYFCQFVQKALEHLGSKQRGSILIETILFICFAKLCEMACKLERRWGSCDHNCAQLCQGVKIIEWKIKEKGVNGLGKIKLLTNMVLGNVILRKDLIILLFQGNRGRRWKVKK